MGVKMGHKNLLINSKLLLSGRSHRYYASILWCWLRIIMSALAGNSVTVMLMVVVQHHFSKFWGSIGAGGFVKTYLPNTPYVTSHIYILLTLLPGYLYIFLTWQGAHTSSVFPNIHTPVISPELSCDYFGVVIARCHHLWVMKSIPAFKKEVKKNISEYITCSKD